MTHILVIQVTGQLEPHHNATPPWSLSLLVHWCTGAPADSLLLSATCSKSQGHAIWSRLSQGSVGWVRVLGESWMLLGRRYTGNPESPPLQIDIPVFFFTLDWTCKIF